MLQTSGSTSTLLGGFFLGMSDVVSGIELTSAEVIGMFRGALEGVKKQTKAQRGDKTMMDALIPAVEAMEACPSTDIKEIMQTAATAALQGAIDTVQMKANFGRARNYGERSVGSADTGATSWACMFQSFAEAI
jgi:dihydroxyacetone kinase-like protein